MTVLSTSLNSFVIHLSVSSSFPQFSLALHLNSPHLPVPVQQVLEGGVRAHCGGRRTFLL